ncbi:isopentenyl-adenosine A37 tRNA methylthiolase [uncultured Alphaproteobacteria bacterium]|uniref:tRNA-2-methylthio-N(6)-dimethylallyladenosine synthase n=1 Tax=uncultured Alphaproteobacteria bacterium TaxID=91750 RepID=A0A212K9Y4_9PROT|nr:isopentenyl-adenosine A37 tRNA methylthiolase [uncultured Alphaproteobacteria bacterium]
MSERKKVFIKTYGCQMNVYDTARMKDVLAPLGYVAADTPADADLVVLNTCHIREKAAEKVYSDLGRLRPFAAEKAERGGRMLVAVAGCVAQAEGEAIKTRAPIVDIVLGPQTYHRLPEMVARALREDGAVFDTEFPVEPKFDFLPPPGAAGPSAFLAIQEGCDRFCTYCVVPYTRGAEYARPAADVLAEARRLVATGAREITLLGQNVNAWAADGWSFGRLLRELAEIDGLDRLRYTTSHPLSVDDDLIAAHRDVPKLVPFLHLPIQSGSDRVLKAMNRGHTVARYLDTVARLKAARPDLAMSSDFIVGFPGETDAEFAETLAVIREVGFVQAFSFKYSARPGTPAALMPKQVPQAVAEARLAALQAELGGIQAAFNAACVGKALPVLFDRPGRHAGQLIGRSPTMQAVHAEAPADAMGTIRAVRIVGVGPNSLAGELLPGDEREAAE